MRKITCIIILLLLKVLVFAEGAQEGFEGIGGKVAPNIASVSSHYPDGYWESGFGIIIGKQNDNLVLLTCHHLITEGSVRSNQLDIVFFTDQEQVRTGIVIEGIMDAGMRDFALIEVADSNNVIWEPNCLAPRYSSLYKMKVMNLGTSTGFEIPPLKKAIQSFRPNNKSLITIEGKIEDGYSGAIIFSNEGIIGMCQTSAPSLNSFQCLYIRDLKEEFEEAEFTWIIDFGLSYKEHLLATSDKAWHEGKHDTAMAYYQEAMNLDPENPFIRAIYEKFRMGEAVANGRKEELLNEYIYLIPSYWNNSIPDVTYFDRMLLLTYIDNSRSLMNAGYVALGDEPKTFTSEEKQTFLMLQNYEDMLAKGWGNEIGNMKADLSLTTAADEYFLAGQYDDALHLYSQTLKANELHALERMSYCEQMILNGNEKRYFDNIIINN